MIRLKAMVPEDFVQYKKCSMFLGTSYCDFKCATEGGFPIGVCQNCELAQSPIIERDIDSLIEEYLKNPLTSAVVFGGLEPILQFEEVLDFITRFREVSNDDVVIYTGYYLEEIDAEIGELKKFSNIYLKCGRFKIGSEKIYDEVLGVTLASSNQKGYRLEELNGD